MLYRISGDLPKPFGVHEKHMDRVEKQGNIDIPNRKDGQTSSGKCLPLFPWRCFDTPSLQSFVPHWFWLFTTCLCLIARSPSAEWLTPSRMTTTTEAMIIVHPKQSLWVNQLALKATWPKRGFHGGVMLAIRRSVTIYLEQSWNR